MSLARALGCAHTSSAAGCCQGWGAAPGAAPTRLAGPALLPCSHPTGLHWAPAVTMPPWETGRVLKR